MLSINTIRLSWNRIQQSCCPQSHSPMVCAFRRVNCGLLGNKFATVWVVTPLRTWAPGELKVCGTPRLSFLELSWLWDEVLVCWGCSCAWVGVGDCLCSGLLVAEVDVGPFNAGAGSGSVRLVETSWNSSIFRKTALVTSKATNVIVFTTTVKCSGSIKVLALTSVREHEVRRLSRLVAS